MAPERTNSSATGANSSNSAGLQGSAKRDSGAGRIGVLVVDDSAFMRRIMERIITDDPELVVVGAARDGAEALELLAADMTLPAPAISVVTLDVEMPGLGGLEVLRRIGRRYPVVVVSALTKSGAETTIQALELGALDVVPKPDVAGGAILLHMAQDLVAKVKSAAGARLRPAAQAVATPAPQQPQQPWQPQVSPAPPPGSAGPSRSSAPSGSPAAVLIGTSTGGPQALRQLIPALPASFPVPVIVAQHMPRGFTGPLADRLNELSPLEVREAADGDVLAPGLVLVAPAGRQTILHRHGSQVQVSLEDKAPFATPFRPSVDLLFLTGVEAYGASLAGVVMTGMGRDGLEGVRAIKKAGGIAVAEAEETCVVYGMPREVIEAGLADYTSPLPRLPGLLAELVRGARSHSR